MRFIIIHIFAICILLLSTGSVLHAQNTGEQTLDRKIELATEMHKFRPSKIQVNSAIDQIASAYPSSTREAFKTSMRRVLNYKAIEKISIDAMAETYTQEELEAMVGYYSKPEAQSATEKYSDYAGKVRPELIKMIDKAMMRIKTGEN